MKHTMTFFKKILSAIFILTIISCGGAKKIANEADRDANKTTDERTRDGWKVVGVDRMSNMVADYVKISKERSESGNLKFLSVVSLATGVDKQDAYTRGLFLSKNLMAQKIQTSVQSKSTFDVNSSKGQAYRKYLEASTQRTAAKLSGGNEVYMFWRDCQPCDENIRKGVEVEIGLIYSFEAALDMYRQELLLQMARESDDFRKQAESEFNSAKQGM